MRIPTTFYTIAFCCAVAAVTQAQQEPRRFTRADTLRGSNGPARAWWDELVSGAFKVRWNDGAVDCRQSFVSQTSLQRVLSNRTGIDALRDDG